MSRVRPESAAAKGSQDVRARITAAIQIVLLAGLTIAGALWVSRLLHTWQASGVDLHLHALLAVLAARVLDDHGGGGLLLGHGPQQAPDQLEQLSRMYMPMMKAAQEAGLIKSYKLLTGGYSNMDDFDLMLLVEIENMAALDETPEREAKWKAVREKVRASLGQDAEDEIQATYRKIRSIQGSKLMREQILR